MVDYTLTFHIKDTVIKSDLVDFWKSQQSYIEAAIVNKPGPMDSDFLITKHKHPQNEYPYSAQLLNVINQLIAIINYASEGINNIYWKDEMLTRIFSIGVELEKLLKAHAGEQE